ncbi:MAG: hypothetical protein D6730_23495 [Bacteroidetes bacterium]|nr:MAG: hypothetical protein D6730_23495 [Bacteroidota bacterium]
MKRTLLFLLFLNLFGFLSAQSGSDLFHLKAAPAATQQQGVAVFTQPPARPPRAMAEWEEVEYLLISWVQYPFTLREIVRHAQKHCKVLILCADSLVVHTFLLQGGVVPQRVSYLQAYPNSVWIRDYGPQCVYANDLDSLMLVDWLYNRPRERDDHLPYLIGQRLGLPVLATTHPPYDLVNTGGNFLTDGLGTAFATRLVLQENDQQGAYNLMEKTEARVDEIMRRFMGIRRYIKLPMLPYDRIHHLDMHMKLLNEETLLVGQYPKGIADGPQIEANLKYLLAHYHSPFGTPYQVVRIPMPSQTGKYPDNQQAEYRTYTNAVFINRLILVPQYNCMDDFEALAIYRKLFPGYEVVGIDVTPLIQSGGALHCVTQTIGVRQPLRMVHQPLRQVRGWKERVNIEAEIAHASGIAYARIHYATDQHGFRVAEMQQQPGSHRWVGEISLPAGAQQLYYYLEAGAANGNMRVLPLGAPAGAWQVNILREEVYR